MLLDVDRMPRRYAGGCDTVWRSRAPRWRICTTQRASLQQRVSRVVSILELDGATERRATVHSWPRTRREKAPAAMTDGGVNAGEQRDPNKKRMGTEARTTGAMLELLDTAESVDWTGRLGAPPSLIFGWHWHLAPCRGVNFAMGSKVQEGQEKHPTSRDAKGVDVLKVVWAVV